MAEYNAFDEYPWSEDLYDETGDVDMDRLMQILEENPDLMQQFQEMYGEETNYMTDGNIEYAPALNIQDFYFDCVQPNISSAAESIAPLLAVCLLCSIIARCSTSKRFLSHLLYVILGVLILYRFFKENAALLVMYGGIACVLILNKTIRTRVGVILSLLTLVYVIACEFLIPSERWHNVRGAQMVLSMKAISLGFDLASERVKDTPSLTVLSYLLHPGSVIFGPWIPYQYYIDGVTYTRSLFDIKWITQILRSCVLSAIYLLYSSCVTSYLLPQYTSYLGKWPNAYREAQSFRFSHYFVCGLSETTLLLSGVAVFSPTAELSSATQVSQPINVEIPRSLVEVVTSWNLPMHKWLKTYVFKIVKPKYGGFTAILLTYLASSLLHGLNFQLAAVLLSLGFYSYVEHSLRHSISETFSVCIEARRCTSTPCPHRRGYLHVASAIINISFTCLAMFHLAYLGVMFDTSEVEQVKGYSMIHTLSKWENLGYSSHVVALSTYFFYWLIK